MFLLLGTGEEIPTVIGAKHIIVTGCEPVITETLSDGHLVHLPSISCILKLTKQSIVEEKVKTIVVIYSKAAVLGISLLGRPLLARRYNDEKDLRWGHTHRDKPRT